MSGSESPRWNWLEHGVIPAVSALMFAAWVRPVYQALLNWNSVRPVGLTYPAWLIVLIPWVVATLQVALQERCDTRWLGPAVGLPILLVTLVYLTPEGAGFLQQPARALWHVLLSLGRFGGRLPASLLLLVLTAILIVRGMLVDWMAHADLWRTFVMGIVALGILMLLPASVTAPLALGRAMASFLVWGLMSLAIIAVANMLYNQRALGKKAPSVSRHWLVVVSVAVGGVILVGWGLGLLFSPETVAEIVRWFDPIRKAIGAALSWVLTAIVYVIFLVLEPLINWLASLIAKREMPKIELVKPLFEQLEELEQQQTATGAPPPWGAIAAGLVVVVIIVLLIAAWRQKRRDRITAGVDEQREYIGNLDLFLSQLRDLFNAGRRKGRGLFADTLDQRDPRQRVRLLYRRLLLVGCAIEEPRLRGQTPTTYACRLARLNPEEGGDLQALTAAYHLVRYADEAPTPEALARAEHAIAHIEDALKPR